MWQYWWAIVIHDKTTNNNFTKFSWEKGTNFPLCKFKTKVLLEKWNRDCDTTNVTSIYKLRNNYLNDIIISASEDIRQGVIHKVRRLRFRNFSSSSPPVFGHTILAYPPLAPTPLRPLYLHLSTRVRILFFKADMTYILWMTIKRPHIALQNKIYKAIGKCPINTNESPGIETMIFTVRGDVNG